MSNVVLFISCTFGLLTFSLGVALALSHGESRITDLIVKMLLLCISSIVFLSFFLGFIANAYDKVTLFLMSIPSFLFGCITIRNNSGKIKNMHFSVPSGIAITTWVSTFLIVGTLAVILCLTVLLKVYDWDGNTYHIPNLIDYIQNKRISLVEKSLWSNVYPRNVEMLNMYMLVFFRDTFLIKMPQFIALLLGGIAVKEILVECGFDKQNSLCGAIVFLSTPIFLAQATSVYIDTFLSTIIICSINFLYKYYRAPTLQNVFYVSLCMGIMLGSKYSAIAYTAVVFIAFLIITIRKRRKILSALSISFLFLFTLGCPWYLFNWINTGNPMYPFKVSFAQYVLFNGVPFNDAVMRANVPGQLVGLSTVFQTLLSWTSVYGKAYDTFLKQIMVTFDERVGGLGFTWLYLLLPIFVISFLHAIRTRKRIAEIIIIAGIPIVLFLLTPEPWWSRYTSFIVVVGVWGLCYFFDQISVVGFVKDIVRWVLPVFILVNCLSGCYYPTSRYFKAIPYPLQLPKSYLYDIYPLIDLDTPLVIVDFRFLTADQIYMFGSQTQNRYSWYSANIQYAESLESVNTVRTLEDIHTIIAKKEPDYIVIATGYFDAASQFVKNPFNGFSFVCSFDMFELYRNSELY